MRAKTLSLTLGTTAALLLCLILRRRDSFTGKVVAVTGGSRGLGLALARRLAREQAKLALIARDDRELARAKSELLSLGSVVTTWPCDVCNQSLAESTVQRIGQEFGQIDILINNAGEIVVGPLGTMTRADFERALDIHFWAPLTLTFSALPYLRKTKNSQIVNIASFGGRLAVPHLTPYCVSKFALAGFSDAIRAELAASKIFVTTVAPGLMRTGSHKNALFKGNHQDEFAWFSLGSSNPLLSMHADRAARQILDAVRRRRPDLVIIIPARIGIIAQALFPNFVAQIVKLIARLLPAKPVLNLDEIRTGWQSESWLSPSVLTYLADRASAEFNELREPTQ
jgi:short-subunit dehydrogenase